MTRVTEWLERVKDQSGPQSLLAAIETSDEDRWNWLLGWARSAPSFSSDALVLLTHMLELQQQRIERLEKALCGLPGGAEALQAVPVLDALEARRG